MTFKAFKFCPDHLLRMNLFRRMIVVACSVVLLDYASQAAINPCESLMADILHTASNDNSSNNQSQISSMGYNVYSGMLSLGSCVGYFLSSLNWDKVSSL